MIVKFFQHDIRQGLVKYIGRYILAVLIGAIACGMVDQAGEYFQQWYGQNLSIWEYGLNLFQGQSPFVFKKGSNNSFEVPMTWFMLYLCLMFCVGDYIRQDMHGFGMYMMVKSRKRSIWWCSKCVWCICVNLLYFACAWLGTLAYAWARYGEISFRDHITLANMIYGTDFIGVGASDMLVNLLVLPLMVGIIQSLLQMILTVQYSSSAGMVVVFMMLVVSSYYGSSYLPHGYAMIARFFSSDGADALSVRFGLLYLTIWIIALWVIGYIIVRKKDVFGRE